VEVLTRGSAELGAVADEALSASEGQAMAAAIPSAERQGAQGAGLLRSAGPRLLFVDNLRVFLTILVILHHFIITYAGSGDAYYVEGKEDIVTNAIGGWFCATNQSYFMGLFLLISAYFVPGSYDRKGAGRFVKDRLIRLGIPLAVYSWVINPVFVYLLHADEIDMAFWRYFPVEYFRDAPLIGAGPLWFVEVLLIFSLAYAAWRRLFGSRRAAAPQATAGSFPRARAIVLFAVGLSLVTFLVRIVFVMDKYNFGPLNLQLAFFAQYIALFVLGLVAYRRSWLTSLPDRVGRIWLGAAGVLILLWPPMMIVNGAIDDRDAQKGGFGWEALLYASWESFMCVSMCIGLIYLFRRRLNRRGRVAGYLVPNAYTAYIIHAPVITALSLAVAGVALYPLLKFAALAPVAVALCFAFSSLIRKLPYADRVL
jgi:glucan biosynthesis protein C